MLDKSKHRGKYGRLDINTENVNILRARSSETAVLRELTNIVKVIAERIVQVELKRAQISPEHPIWTRLVNVWRDMSCY
jgi:hypothetical protein